MLNSIDCEPSGKTPIDNTENLATNRENWRSIDGYNNYEVSWWGRVRNATTDRILKQATNKGGYLFVCLCKNGKRKVITMHQLVAREWVLNPECKRCVDHIDGDKINNHHANLMFATYAENTRNMKNTQMVPASTKEFRFTNKQTSGTQGFG